MLNRRQFCVGACCAGASAGRGPAANAADLEGIVCGTVYAPDVAFSLEAYSAALGLDVARVRATLARFKLTPFGTALLAKRWRKTDGLTPNTGKITLGIHFLDGSSADRSRVMSIAPKWLEGELGNAIAFKFDVPRKKSQVRISFASDGGNTSEVGRDALPVSSSKKTMNLQQTTDRAILHEFGHALGLSHEHAHPKSGIVWTEPVVIAELYAKYGWSEAKVRANVMNRYSKEYACIGDKSFNRKSIMMYEIPERWTLNGFSSKLTTKISARDRSCVVGIYSV